MCKRNKDGYIMDDGTLIPFSGVKIEDIKPEHIVQLSKENATAWDIYSIKTSLHTLRSDIQSILNESTEEMKKVMTTHTRDCPINKEKVRTIAVEALNEEITKKKLMTDIAVGQIIEEKLRVFPKKMLLNYVEIAKALAVVIGGVALAVFVILKVQGLIN